MDCFWNSDQKNLLYIYIYIEKGKQINQKYTSNICEYISTFVLVNTDQTFELIRN